MTEQELFTKNLNLPREFDLYLVEHPEVAERIPANALIVLLPEDDPELCVKNQELAQARREPGQTIVSVRVARQAVTARIERPLLRRGGSASKKRGLTTPSLSV